MEDRRASSPEVERDDFPDEIENAVAFNNENDQTNTPHTSCRAITNCQHLDSVYHLPKKNGFAVDQKTSEDDQEEFNTECKSDNETHNHTRRVVLIKEVDSSEAVDSCVLSESANQTCRSYLYEKNPLSDPRFTRLIEQLVPLRRGIQAERKKVFPARKTNLSDKNNEICFKDICLNDTCRLVFKIMNQGRRL